MGSISRANVFDVLANKPRDRVVHVIDDHGKAERRIIKRPEGRSVEQFVDPSGNVVWIQLLQLGTTHGIEQIDRKRGQLRRDGFVDYNKCPLRNGAAAATPALEDEFGKAPRKLQQRCECDPTIHEKKNGKMVANDPCPHIAWLVESRRARAAELAESRATKIETATSLEKQRLELQQQQLEEQRHATKLLIDALGDKNKK